MGMDDWLHAPAALPLEKEPLVPSGYKAVYAVEPIWTLWKKKKYLRPFRNRTPAVKSAVDGCTDCVVL
jgi:hypothetical protein